MQRYTIGAEGDLQLFGKPAPWNIYGQYGRAKLREQLRNIMNFQRTIERDRRRVRAGRQPRRLCGRHDRSAASTSMPSRPMTIAHACRSTAWASASPTRRRSPISWAIRTATRRCEQYAAGANLSTTPFATWAGDVSVAIGAEYRKEKIKGFVPTQFQPLITTTTTATGTTRTTTNLWSVGNYLPSNGSYNVKEAYLETVVPLGLGHRIQRRGPGDRLFDGRLCHDLEGRRDLADHARRPLPRHAVARHPGAQPGGSVRGGFVEQRLGLATPAGRAATLNGVTYVGSSIGYSATVTGNPDLKPEKADTWNIGAVFTPTFIPGFSVSADYFRIDVGDAIGSLSAQEIVEPVFPGRRLLIARQSGPIRRHPPVVS